MGRKPKSTPECPMTRVSLYLPNALLARIAELVECSRLSDVPLTREKIMAELLAGGLEHRVIGPPPPRRTLYDILDDKERRDRAQAERQAASRKAADEMTAANRAKWREDYDGWVKAQGFLHPWCKAMIQQFEVPQAVVFHAFRVIKEHLEEIHAKFPKGTRRNVAFAGLPPIEDLVKSVYYSLAFYSAGEFGAQSDEELEALWPLYEAARREMASPGSTLTEESYVMKRSTNWQLGLEEDVWIGQMRLL